MMFKSFYLGLALSLSAGVMGVVGCAVEADPSVDQALGTLHLPLVTPTQASYKLHTATFVISTQTGTPVATLSSDSDPDAQTLSASLMQGSYSVLLKDGWELDSVAADGTESPVRAALVSHNPQTFKIKATAATELSFTFTTADGTVVIGNGSADISVGVTTSVSLTGCDVTGSYGSSCPSGQTCLLADANGGTFCATPGSLAVGALCSSEQCVAGSQCLKTDPSHPDQGVCTQFCNTNASPFGCNCVNLGFDSSNAGVCGPTPAGACDLLTQTGCSNGQACQYVSGGFGTCGDPGTTPNGSSCSAETCMAGSECYNSVCRQICDTRQGFYNNPGCGVYYSYCYSAGTGFAGRCIY